MGLNALFTVQLIACSFTTKVQSDRAAALPWPSCHLLQPSCCWPPVHQVAQQVPEPVLPLVVIALIAALAIIGHYSGDTNQCDTGSHKHQDRALLLLRSFSSVGPLRNRIATPGFVKCFLRAPKHFVASIKVIYGIIRLWGTHGADLKSMVSAWPSHSPNWTLTFIYLSKFSSPTPNSLASLRLASPRLPVKPRTPQLGLSFCRSGCSCSEHTERHKVRDQQQGWHPSLFTPLPWILHLGEGEANVIVSRPWPRLSLVLGAVGIQSVHRCSLNGFIWAQCFSSFLISRRLTTNA